MVSSRSKPQNSEAEDVATTVILGNSSAAGHGQEELHQHDFQDYDPCRSVASETESQSHAPSPQARLALTKSPSVNSTPKLHPPLLLFADGDDTTRAANLAFMEQVALINGLETGTQDDKTERFLTASGTDHATTVSGEGIEESKGVNLRHDGDAPPVRRHDDESDSHIHTDVVGWDTHQLIAAERETVRVGVEARSPFGLLADGSMPSHHRGSYDLDMEAHMPRDFSVPMDEDDEDNEEHLFGVLSNTTLNPLPAYQPHSYQDSLYIERDALIVDDDSPGAEDSAMEVAGRESWKAAASVTATKTLEPFSWVPPSVSNTFHASFPGISPAPAQMTAFVNMSMHDFEPTTLNGPYAVNMMVSEAELRQVAPPQDTVWPFFSDGTRPSLSTEEVELSIAPESFTADIPPTSVSSASATQTTSCSSLASRAGPIAVSPSTRRTIENLKDEVKGFDREVGPEPAAVASVRRWASPLRCV